MIELHVSFVVAQLCCCVVVGVSLSRLVRTGTTASTLRGKSHVAANKEGPIGNFCRATGRFLDGIGKDKRRQQQPTSQAIVVAQPQEQVRPKGLWSRITDELVSGAQYIEGRMFPASSQRQHG